MPGTDLQLDSTGDFIDDGAGFFEETNTAQPAVRHQVMTMRGQWIGDADAGRESKGIPERLNTEAEAELEANATLNALEELEIEGLISDIRVKVNRDALGRFAIQTEMVDAQAGGTITIQPLTEFGG
jgi:hypothetical protein